MFSRTGTHYRADEGVAPTLINWRAVFGGAVIGIGIMIFLSALWLAFAFPSDVGLVRQNLDWFLGGTAIFSLFVAGYMAGFSSGARGLGAGLVQAFTLWALVIIAALAIAIPSTLRVLGLNFGTALRGGPVAGPLWTGVWSMLIALGATVVGGMLGGATPRRSHVRETEGHEVVEQGRPATAETRVEETASKRRAS